MCTANILNFFRCSCLDGFEGPRCQQLKHSFDGNSWAWYRPLTQCAVGKISLEFATKDQNALILYNGPMLNTQVGDNRNFIALELEGGYPKISVDFGDGMVQLDLDYTRKDVKDLSDGNWHTVEFIQNLQVTL